MKIPRYCFVPVLVCAWVWAGPSGSLEAGGEGTKPSGAPLSDSDHAATELGYKVQAIMHAIENPKEPGAMHAVTSLGHDQRHYVMVRGWLAYQLQGDMSILEANKEQTPAPIRERIEFLQKAIRALDLE